MLHPIDPVDRDVEFMPTRNPFDPRWMLMGRVSPNNPNEWETGFFDKDSFHVC